MAVNVEISVENLPIDDNPIRFDRILAKSPVMKKTLQEVLLAAAAEVPVLILGETGTGKELVAHSIHQRSARRNGPFVAVNLGALPADLIASELFGHEKGAYTGAFETQPGKLAQAEGGTLFLDEVDCMDWKAQVALLRVLESKEYQRVGGRQNLSCRVRIVAACNKDLRRLAEEGKFRQDLFYRLEVFSILLPPLRERPGGVSFLGREFLRDFNSSHGLAVTDISADAMQRLEAYRWPGNIRELKNVIQRGALMARQGLLEERHLPPRLRPDHPADPQSFSSALGLPLREMERAYIRQTLAMTKGNKAAAARMLKISRKALYQKLKRV